MKKKKEPTLLAQLIAQTDVNHELDNSCKKLLSHKLILAWILKYSVAEFAGHSVEAIAGRYILEDSIQISKEKQITGLNTECQPPGDRKNTFDLLFRVYLPGSKKTVNMLINIEAQGNFYPRYPILKRGIFYACRLISSQLGAITENTNYSGLQKVYSIWICTNPPLSRSGSITKYIFSEQNIIGSVRELRKNYDLLSILVVCLNRPNYKAVTQKLPESIEDIRSVSGITDTPSELVDMLSTLLSPTLSIDQKKTILESRFGLPMTTEIKEDVYQMCNISRSIKIEALKEGFYKGMEQGISQGTFITLFDLFKDGIISLEEAARRADLSPTAFQNKILELQSQ